NWRSRRSLPARLELPKAARVSQQPHPEPRRARVAINQHPLAAVRKGLPTRRASEIHRFCVVGIGVHCMHPCLPGEGRRVAKASQGGPPRGPPNLEARGKLRTERRPAAKRRLGDDLPARGGGASLAYYL